MIIDSHHHFWDRSQAEFDYSWLESSEMASIRRDFLPGDLSPLLIKSGIDKSILVQTQHNVAENRWALELARKNDFIAGVVGYVDLRSSNCQAQVEEFASDPLFVGVRHITQDEPDPDFIVSEPVCRGLQILQDHDIPFDLLLYRHHLRHVPTVAGRFREMRFVIDHLSKPAIRKREIAGWKQEIRKAAEFPNVFCKLSGLVTEADWGTWSVRDLQPYADAAIEAFGPDRIMFGSDWPVCLLAANYEAVFQAAQEMVAGLTVRERQKIFCETARRFYKLVI